MASNTNYIPRLACGTLLVGTEEITTNGGGGGLSTIVNLSNGIEITPEVGVWYIYSLTDRGDDAEFNVPATPGFTSTVFVSSATRPEGTIRINFAGEITLSATSFSSLDGAESGQTNQMIIEVAAVGSGGSLEFCVVSPTDLIVKARASDPTTMDAT